MTWVRPATHAGSGGPDLSRRRPAAWCPSAGGGRPEADPGEVLLTTVVRALASGKGFVFTDRGGRPVKGITEPLQLWSLDTGA